MITDIVTSNKNLACTHQGGFEPDKFRGLVHNLFNGLIFEQGKSITVENDLPDFNDEEEYYLHLELEPFTDKIRVARIIDSNEIKSLKDRPLDRVLNIFLPVYKSGDQNQYYTGPFNLLQTRVDKAATCYIDQNQLVIGPIVVTTDNKREFVKLFPIQRTDATKNSFAFISITSNINSNGDIEPEDITQIVRTNAIETMNSRNPYDPDVGAREIITNIPICRISNDRLIIYSEGVTDLYIKHYTIKEEGSQNQFVSIYPYVFGGELAPLI